MSGVGKGLATASIGKILQQYGFKTTAIKIDPYINVDAGTLRPTEHGEVWVTSDGGEIDQDLGHYERFLGIEIPKQNNITTGQIYKTIIEKERAGKFLGETVQFIPHIPDEIIRRIKKIKGFDFVLIEIGGTVGDYENIPFLFAIKSLEREIGKENMVYILITYLPIPVHITEMKTKPTLQAIRLLSENGIFPDFILCRSKKPLDSIRKKKIETYANIPSDSVISAPDVDIIYTIPLNFEKDKLGEKILKKFNLKPEKKPNWTNWKNLINNIKNPQKIIKIAIVGKYVDIGNYNLTDSYISINQALEHAACSLNTKIKIDWVDSKKLEKGNTSTLKDYDGVVIPGGFGATGTEGKIAVIKFVRDNNIPFLGLCYGLQLAIVEFARNVCNLENPHTTEVNPKTEYPVIDILPTQKKILKENKYGASMRLGDYAAVLKEGTKVYQLYQQLKRLEKDREKLKELKNNPKEVFRLGILENNNIILERHRHRYEVNPKFINILEKNGLVFSGYHIRQDNTRLIEFMELPTHKFFIATQAHPEFKSRLENPAPLFYGFVKACIQ